MPWFHLLVACGVCSAIFALIEYAAARLLQLPVLKVSIFAGPKLISRQIGFTAWEIGTFPLSGGIEFDPWVMSEASLAKRALVFLAGWSSFFAIACVICGLEPACMSIQSGFYEVFSPFFGFEQPKLVVRQLVEFLRAGSLWKVIGFTAAKEFAMNVMPLSGIVVPDLLGKFLGEEIGNKFRLVYLLIMMALWIGWIVALVSYARGGVS